MADAWIQFERSARERRQRGDFTDVFTTQIYPGNLGNFDGTVRASIFRGYPHPITVPVTPVIRLAPRELERVGAFVRDHQLDDGRPVVLFECASYSGQSFVTPAWANEVSGFAIERLPTVRVVMTSGFSKAQAGTIDGSQLTFREVAALTHYCALFIGCSSGLTWLCTSDAAKRIPMIQCLSTRSGLYGAVADDLDYWGLPSDHVIEMRDVSAERAAHCAVEVLQNGAAMARAQYHQRAPFRLDVYYDLILPLLRKGDVVTMARSLSVAVRRFGPREEFLTALVPRLSAKLKFLRNGSDHNARGSTS
jgi:hypothetical protein